MKTKSLKLTGILLVMGFISMFAQEQVTKKFQVKGKCGMCKNRIEKSASSLEGVENAEWSQQSKTLSVTYKVSETSINDIHQAVANAGHDTEKVKADDATYESLPACCHYDRADE